MSQAGASETGRDGADVAEMGAGGVLTPGGIDPPAGARLRAAAGEGPVWRPDAPGGAWGEFTDERPDLYVRAGSIWPSVLGLVVLAGVAAGMYVRQYELDGGWLDWSRARTETAEEGVGEIAPGAQAGAEAEREVSPGMGAPAGSSAGMVAPAAGTTAGMGAPAGTSAGMVVPAAGTTAGMGAPAGSSAGMVGPAAGTTAGMVGPAAGTTAGMVGPPTAGTVAPGAETTAGMVAAAEPLPMCALDGVLAGDWHYETAAVWAAHAEVFDVRGRYSVAFTPGAGCSYDTVVRKLGSGSTVNAQPRSDRVRLAAEPWGTGGARAVAEVRLAVREDGELAGAEVARDPKGLHYRFEYAVEGERLRGHWRFMDGEQVAMLGVLGGGRGGTGEGALAELPCASQCAVRCPGEEARERCERELCAEASPRVTDCGAPGADFVAPPATRAVDAPLAFFGGGQTGDDACRKIADHVAGTWTVYARATAGKTDREVQMYTLRLQAEGCTLVVKDARRGKWPLEITGSIRADGRWTLHYRDGMFEGDWMLVGRDPAFGSFRARSGVQGTLAAYRTGR